ncbi:MAG: hypothetical protein JNL82_13535 [Myxococcales bacterium]|nr:hypothetical protein [Myxococcales bacterium]
MRRLALSFALLLAACGDETVGTASGSSTTGTGGTSTTGTQPTTGDASSSSSATSSASDSATGTTAAATATSGTTQGLGDSSSGDATTAAASTSDATTGTTSADTTGADTSSSSTSDGSSSDGSSSESSTGSEVVVPPVPDGSCNAGQGELTTFVEPTPQVEELHIVAMYQATAGAATISLTRTGVPLTLFLSSYEPVAFTLDVAPGVQLEHVILDGYNMHTVQGQGAAMVSDISGDFGDPFWVACGYFWPMNDGGCDTPGNVAAAEGLTGLQLTSFAGCYEGISFTLD